MAVSSVRPWPVVVAGLSALTVLLAGFAVPEIQAAASTPEISAGKPEKSVASRPVAVKAADRGAEDRVAPPKKVTTVWPRAGVAEVELADAKAVRAGDLPVEVSAERGSPVRVRVETLDPASVARLGGVGLGVRLSRTDGAATGSLRVSLSYQGFRDAHGGGFAERLGVARVEECALQPTPPAGCDRSLRTVTTANDTRSGRLSAETSTTGVYVVTSAAASDSPMGGTFTATDLKPSGSWQAGGSGGSFTYSYPIPQAPSLVGKAPDLALTYDSGAVDAMSQVTNNQSGWVGLGWDLSAGFVERSYKPCARDEGSSPANSYQSGWADLCWESPDANDRDPATTDATASELTLVLAGQSTQIVKDRASGQYKTVPDHGWRVQSLPGGADGQPYWLITTQDGTKWRLGQSRDSQWRVPYAGNEPGEPCHDRWSGTGTTPGLCVGVWRWNLDQVTDSHQNVTDYLYTREPNYYCSSYNRATCYFPSSVKEYDRGGHLAEVRWGANTRVAGSAPTGRTTFTTVDMDPLLVPTDLRCAPPTGPLTECNNATVAFYASRQLDRVVTSAYDGGWKNVAELRLRYRTMGRQLWLDTVQHTGLIGGQAAKLPPADFDAVELTSAYWWNQGSTDCQLYGICEGWDDFPRIGAIGNGFGGRIEVGYGQPNPCVRSSDRRYDWRGHTTPSRRDCWTDAELEQGGGAPPAGNVYQKWAVTRVVEKDLVTGSPDQVTAYTYTGTPAWTYPLTYVGGTEYPPIVGGYQVEHASQWRGYQTVHTARGTGGPDDVTVSSSTWFRGVDGAQLTDFDAGTWTDRPWLAGQVLQERTWRGAAADVETGSTRYEYWTPVTGDGPGALNPVMVRASRERGREVTAAGGFRHTGTRTSYDAYGLPAAVVSYGDEASTADDTCTVTTYARDPATWMLDLAASVEEHAGQDCTAGAVTARTTLLYDGNTDPAANRPTAGDVTDKRVWSDATHVATTRAGFDAYGRPRSSTDALGKITTIGYIPATGWPSGGVTVTNPLGYAETTVSSPLHGQTVKFQDANGKTTEIDYDALGRTTAVWTAGRPRNGSPTATFAYTIPFDGNLGQPTAPVKTTIAHLQSGTDYLTFHTYEDAWGRPRESQTASPSGGRIVSITTYDGRGLTAAVAARAHNGAAPGSGLLNPALTDLPAWTKSVYDHAGRPTAKIDYAGGAELRRTSTTYGGADVYEIVPPVGLPTEVRLDVKDRPRTITQRVSTGVSEVTGYDYDTRGNLTKLTDANGNVRAFTYDWIGRRVVADDPDSGSSRSTYDAAGRLVATVDGNGQKISHHYDELGRPLSQWAGEVDSGTKLAEWRYDTVAKGEMSSATRFSGGRPYTDSVITYDDDYRPTRTRLTIPDTGDRLAGSYEFATEYDAAGRMIRQTMPAAGGLPRETLTYGYTNLGYAATVTSDYGGGFTYAKASAYSETGRMTARSYGPRGQIVRTLNWDEGWNRLTGLTTKTKADTGSPQTVQDDAFFYDAGDQLRRVADRNQLTPQNQCFDYDTQGRLSYAYTNTQADCSGGWYHGADRGGLNPYWERYAYDKVGNITTKETWADGKMDYTYPAPGPSAVRPNAVTGVSVAGGGRSDFGYDAAGQLTSRTAGGSTTTYTWDPLGKLTQAVVDGQSSQYVYGAAGDRIIRREGAVTTLYLGSMELEASGGVVKAKRYYTTAGGAMMAMRADDGALTWLLGDGQGSAQLAVADATSAVSRQRYLPYGGFRGRDEFPFTDLGFLGKTRDTATGLNLLGARFYDAGLGRFISPDPLLDLRTPRLANPYGYAGNNPVGLSDPSGLKPDNCLPESKRYSECLANERYSNCVRKMGKDKCDLRELEAQVKRELDALFDALRGIAKIAADELGVTAGIDCFTKGDLGACGETALNILSSLAGGLLGKLVTKYGLPTKWAKLADLAESLYRLGEKAINKFKAWSRAKGDLKALEDKLAAAARACSSFVPGTRVVMGDGGSKPIEDVRPGDRVMATDPRTGRTTAQPVLAVHTSTGAKALVEVTVDTGDRTGVILATDTHPFWLPGPGIWQEAARLQPGQWLRTSAGTWVQVTAVTLRTVSSQRVHNLTVAGPQTYHVAAGGADVLVHNTSCIPPPNITQAGLQHSFDRHAAQWFGRPVTKKAKMDEWNELIERASGSSKIVPWQSGSTLTDAYLIRVDGKWFVAQFDRVTGDLVTAFVPNRKQVTAMLRILGKSK
ncbi:RHS repeat-associated core domain-containing protein [Nonomuraea typhae]|uniref:RHS repeat-associated core domain-containing protein n=1 Tax=Nonomuraea typhae TaxID=2603600 RepID=UPI0012FA47ED|nr:RHS repeat-associated core domain-containing protein [Nonomuraea typhae]